MGICFEAITATDAMIAEVLADPPLIWRLYAPEDENMYLSELGVGKKPGIFARLFGAKEISVPDTIPSFEYELGDRITVDLDKSWDGINHCVKKLLPELPLNIFEHGKSVGEGDIEVGYGPARVFTSSETVVLHEAYSKLQPSDLLKALISQEMRSVYPEALWEHCNEETQEYITENYAVLVRFLESAVARGLGLVVAFT